MLDELKGEKDHADERISAMENNLRQAQDKCKELENQIKDKEAKLENLGQLRQEIAKKREEMASVISKLNLDIHGAGKDLQARTQALGLLKARLVSHEDKDKELVDEIQKFPCGCIGREKK